mmetsp:Transcript_1880/g.3944  ORF Transcript_1880/g.3944 Transcript_1880/m.3944 type:complete len:231 (+) Transcript_1880:236-928(+)
MVSASILAIEITLSFSEKMWGGIVMLLVTMTSSIGDRSILSTAPFENTPWEAYTRILPAPAFLHIVATSSTVFPESIRSSTMITSLPFTSPTSHTESRDLPSTSLSSPFATSSKETPTSPLAGLCLRLDTTDAHPTSIPILLILFQKEIPLSAPLLSAGTTTGSFSPILAKKCTARTWGSTWVTGMSGGKNPSMRLLWMSIQTTRSHPTAASICAMSAAAMGLFRSSDTV